MDGALIFFLAAVIIIAVLLFTAITFSKRGGGLDVEKYRVRWLAIEQSLVRDNEASYHMAILNADKLLDQALKDRGTRGNTMGERLKSAKNSLPHRNDIWASHKVRNQIAHEPDFKINYDHARRVLNGFKHGLKDLGAI